MTVPRRWLLLVVLVLFQSHWVDDLGTAGPDTAGLVVSAIGSALIVAGLVAPGVAGRALLALGLAFVAFISVADLVGLQPDGSRTPDLMGHWANGLGWGLTVAVGVTLLCALAALVALRSGAPRRRRFAVDRERYSPHDGGAPR